MHPTPQATPATIRAQDLVLLLAAAKLRRYTKGRTCQLCALTAGPVAPVDCATSNRWIRDNAARAQRGARARVARAQRGARARHARSTAHKPSLVSPLQRGHIALVYERTYLHGGPKAVQRTFGIGIRALRQEPRHVLAGGEAA